VLWLKRVEFGEQWGALNSRVGNGGGVRRRFSVANDLGMNPQDSAA